MRTLGTAKVCITPLRPVRLCGYGFRSKPFDGVEKDLFVRVFDLREEQQQVLLVYGDLLWWNPVVVSRIRKRLKEMYGIGANQLLLVASHNHSGPGTGDCFIPLLETAEEEYVSFLIEKVLEGILLAGKNQEPVTVKRGEGLCPLNVYRRVEEGGMIQMRPNYRVEPDQTLTTISFYRENKSLKGRILHYPCHANISKDNRIHPDYPGYALELSDQEWEDSLSIFWQGCTGDLRPNCVLGNQFRPGSYEDIAEFAGQFHRMVKHVAAQEQPVDPGMKLECKMIPLKVMQTLDKEQVIQLKQDPKEEMRQWAYKVLEKGLPDQELLEVVHWKLGEQSCFFLNGEISMHYAAITRSTHPGAVCTGYTNGMIGYLSTRKQIEEGGYEPKDSAIYFAIAGTYDKEIQETIENALMQW